MDRSLAHRHFDRLDLGNELGIYRLRFVRNRRRRCHQIDQHVPRFGKSLRENQIQIQNESQREDLSPPTGEKRLPATLLGWQQGTKWLVHTKLQTSWRRMIWGK